jgi:hypothetical protein
LEDQVEDLVNLAKVYGASALGKRGNAADMKRECEIGKSLGLISGWEGVRIPIVGTGAV